MAETTAEAQAAAAITGADPTIAEATTAGATIAATAEATAARTEAAAEAADLTNAGATAEAGAPGATTGADLARAIAEDTKQQREKVCVFRVMFTGPSGHLLPLV